MSFVVRRLRQMGYKKVLSPTFALHRGVLEQHANGLKDLLDKHLLEKGAAQVDVVTYSMGGLLFRASLVHDIPYRRVVMLSPPNQGAHLAQVVRQAIPIHRSGWDPLHQLLPSVSKDLPEPTENIEVAILAGSKGSPRGYNPLIPGDNDGKVSIKETFLHRETLHRTVRSRHPMMLLKPSILEETAFFLEHGHLS